MKTILVAEDDKFLANAYRVKLTKAGFDVHIAGDGEEVLALLKSITPDIILLDLVMPVKDGFLTLAAIKSDEKLKSIPVVVASNLGQKEDTERALNLGAYDFVIKSDLSLNTLIEKINKILDPS